MVGLRLTLRFALALSSIPQISSPSNLAPDIFKRAFPLPFMPLLSGVHPSQYTLRQEIYRKEKQNTSVCFLVYVGALRQSAEPFTRSSCIEGSKLGPCVDLAILTRGHKIGAACSQSTAGSIPQSIKASV